ncbi:MULTISPECIES: hypothetical protein [Comamonadaceae]|uniref:hypothetical protein n=1 Tax=Comamonadaceae TaxID=80864 RepID=UPI002724E627|nr:MULTISPECIES: hypothetical protein [Comamonadaceae]MDO9144240.1 hypothetical protein [Rhodoferax sp.]MDP3886737.1 hypothetical protein [Hydrogenophaga sp.]
MSELVPNALHAELTRLYWSVEQWLGCVDTVDKIELDPHGGHRCSQKLAGPPGEKAPIGLILCAESSREQVELLQRHKDGIIVAEYWTELPPKAELQQKLHAALIEACERLARRGVLLEGLDDA